MSAVKKRMEVPELPRWMGSATGCQWPPTPRTRMVVPCQAIPAPNLARAWAVSSVSSALRALLSRLSPGGQSRGHQGPVGVALGAGQGEAGLDRLTGFDGFFHGSLKVSVFWFPS